jgi:hypothetical protein|mmetsp:Transcript_12423/g.20341  ORF Transcript_12423/g.20341 Transcript_12423/m.20341 type:complete len:244 (+) Transcript_12423:133-864(+)|eukprot:CAMPEP_0169071152 /NCGR_PEP_ID=MMETSP1015-20121227/5507_1 /TAXON_ID=342587 /ORGANISM="Karlodinium micrum, Strain CCMP2283" /LENGTH=243 /DNA_ID=CAMNT_0009130219 /DNA_START=127 /DNA_END=858 /DNA_ORIENTATION=+
MTGGHQRSYSLVDVRSRQRDQVASNLHGSAAYSFGRPKHRKGSFKIPVIDNRSPDYIPGFTGTPGPGDYDIHGTVSRHDTKYGHPGISRTGGSTFGNLSEPRDCINSQPAHGSFPATIRRRLTRNSNVRSDSCLDTPGPGAYLGLNEGLRHGMPGKMQMDMPSYSMRLKCAPIENNPRRPPGPGPHEYDTRHKQIVANNRQPTWVVPKTKRVSQALLPNMGTAEHVGPGTYEHPTSFHTKFPL